MTATGTLAITMVLLGVAAPAFADDVERAAPVGVHTEAAVTLAGGDNTFSVAFRGYLGASVKTPGSLGRWRPFLGAGLHVGSGVIGVEDPRALDGSVDLTYSTIGPELRAGLVYVDGGFADSQLYLAAAPLRVMVDERLMLDAVDGVVGGGGLRLSVGVTWADQWFQEAFRDDVNEWSWVAVFMPVLAEVTFERSAGFDRGGVSFGWGF